MTVQDLIKNKDYDYIEWRITSPKYLGEGDMLFGCCKSINGKLISLDGDSYCEETEILNHEEWSNENVKNGLTVLQEGNWSSDTEE